MCLNFSGHKSSNFQMVFFVSDGCKDNYSGCPGWSKSPKKYCENHSWVKNNCKKSCQLCDGKETNVYVVTLLF